MRGQTIRILLVDDHSLMRTGLASAIVVDPLLTVCGEAATAANAIQLYRDLRPDVALMDLRLPDSSGILATKAICGEFPEAKIIVVSTFAADEEIHGALEAGARAYLVKTIEASDLRAVIHAVQRGERYLPPEIAARLAHRNPQSDLTERELGVLQHIVRGRRNKEIAEALGITEGTVKTHVANILVKLGAGDRTQAVTLAIQRGIVHVT
jgi:two-component system, NarL family, response regulator